VSFARFRDVQLIINKQLASAIFRGFFLNIHDVANIRLKRSEVGARCSAFKSHLPGNCGGEVNHSLNVTTCVSGSKNKFYGN
jgi:hypothetical protein